MPRVVLRKGYRCQPGKRRELLAALQRVDAAATAAGWPRGRYLLVETKSPGEPDVEVEFTFESYAEMEQLERRLREHLTRNGREVGSAGQEFLLEPSATRYLVMLDDAPAGAARAQGASGAARRAPEVEAVPEAVPAPPPAPALTPAQQRARQLAQARAAMESAERAAGLPPEKRASQRRFEAPDHTERADGALADPDDQAS
jgi:hypothetical protein